MKDDNFNFDTQEVKNYLLQNSGCIDTEESKVEESKEQIEEESNEVVTFKRTGKSRGAPKKEKRPKNVWKRKKTEKVLIIIMIITKCY